MKHFNIINLIFISGILIFSGCESVNESQVVADEFYAALNIEDYSSIVNMLDKELVTEVNNEQFLQIFKQHSEYYGKIKSHSKYGFHTSTNKGQTIVKLRFNVECENGLAYESIKFIKRSDGYKIFAYSFDNDKSEIDKDN